MKPVWKRSALLATSVLSVGLATSAHAQEGGAAIEAADIVVTARRTEERLQDVPVSVTVFNQEQLSNANITNAADLVQYTPSLQANTRWGADAASFSIRGFAQEARTTASVATYFGEVVTPRGGGTIAGGDGAGPGALFDLQNVQVLNGPQGTLFGRNTTGGAVLLVPNRPTDEFGGYLEVSAGDYDMRRAQGVLNVPLGDAARLRVGMDRQEREGYLENLSPVGPSDFNDVNYESYRIGFVADLASNLENYTIATYTHSLTNGGLNRLAYCSTNPFFAFGGYAQLNSNDTCTHAAFEGTNVNQNDFHEVWNSVEDPQVSSNIWQVQNITTWDVSDTLRVRGILSYAELKGYSRGDVNGTYLTVAGIDENGNPAAGVPGTPFATTGLGEDYDSANQNTYSAELQFQGSALDDRLEWQAGLYYEESDPQAITGSLSQTLWRCDNSPGSDPRLWSGCVGAGSTGGGGGYASLVRAGLSYQTQALYGQASYDITDDLKLTAGYRYTWDRTDADSSQIQFRTPPNIPVIGRAVGASCVPGYGLPNTTIVGSIEDACFLSLHNRSEAPTWTIGLDYQLTDSDMVYAKYSRGYRQASINVYAPSGFQNFDAEQVDAYEIGAKTGFDGMFPGIFNVALFYNDLSNAQLQAGFVSSAGSPTIAILNAGGVTTYGAEVQLVLELFEDFTLNLGYGYLNTHLDSAPQLGGLTPTTVYFTGQELFNMPENKVTVGLNYVLPLPENVGDITLGATYSYIDEQLISADSTRQRVMPSYEVVNLNVNWDGVFGGPWDGAIFVTNALDAEYVVWENGLERYLNFEAGTPAPPRMIGARLRYRFGGDAN